MHPYTKLLKDATSDLSLYHLVFTHPLIDIGDLSESLLSIFQGWEGSPQFMVWKFPWADQGT
jgi:hypothetical protein